MKHITFFNLSYFDENDNLVVENFHLTEKKIAIYRYVRLRSNVRYKEVRFTQLRVYRHIIETTILDDGKPF